MAFQSGNPSKITKKKFDLLQSIGFGESIYDNDYVGEPSVADMTGVPDDQKKKRAATGKSDESQFAGGMVAQPNIFGNPAGQQQQQYAEHHFYPGSQNVGQGTSGQGVGHGYDNSYAQHPSYQQQGYGGHSY